MEVGFGLGLGLGFVVEGVELGLVLEIVWLIRSLGYPLCERCFLKLLSVLCRSSGLVLVLVNLFVSPMITAL